MLGTQDKPFNRALKMVDSAIDKGLIKGKVIVQAGYTKYESKNMEIFDFVSPSKMKEYIKKSDYVITHGGVGSIIDSLKENKKVIAIARLSKYGEHTNDHQVQIIEEFTKLGYILNGTYDLEKEIKKLNKFKPNKYKSNHDNFVNLITNYIDNN
jgi:UDP-N-acetylglucosamine transferase subunit ALG13